MYTQLAYSHVAEGISRRKLLQMGLTAGLTVSTLPLSRPAPLWGAEAAPPKRGGILRVRGSWGRWTCSVGSGMVGPPHADQRGATQGKFT